MEVDVNHEITSTYIQHKSGNLIKENQSAPKKEQFGSLFVGKGRNYKLMLPSH